MKVKKFFIEDVRCLAGRQEFEIRPLTFLVGENSTGKTTALGCFHILANLLSGFPLHIDNSALDFNIQPFAMGSFDDIVSRKKPKCEKFKLGFAFESGSIQEITVPIIQKKESTEPELECISIKFKHGELHITIEKSQYPIVGDDLFFRFDDQKTNIDNQIFYVTLKHGSSLERFFFYNLNPGINQIWRNPESSEEKALSEFLKNETDIISFHEIYLQMRSFSFAPVRSHPKRTYDPTKEFDDPEGNNMPTRLKDMKLFKGEEWFWLREQLNEFGRSSGLFEKIEIKIYEKSASSPFQIRIKVRGPQSSIIDVGYGVSQILPILVKILTSEESGFFLLQQPEVHLHPKGQAELTSLFVTLARQEEQSFIIETHSDYMVDRARIEIKKGHISPQDVSLIYMEPNGSRVKVHNIGFDEQANLINVPASYRKFFSKETDNLLWLSGENDVHYP